MASAVAGQCGSTLISRRGGLLLSSSSSTYNNGGMKLDLRVPLPMQGSAMVRAPLLILAMAPKKKGSLYMFSKGTFWRNIWALACISQMVPTVNLPSLIMVLDPVGTSSEVYNRDRQPEGSIPKPSA